MEDRQVRGEPEGAVQDPSWQLINLPLGFNPEENQTLMVAEDEGRSYSYCEGKGRNRDKLLGEV